MGQPHDRLSRTVRNGSKAAVNVQVPTCTAECNRCAELQGDPVGTIRWSVAAASATRRNRRHHHHRRRSHHRRLRGRHGLPPPPPP